MAKSDDEAARTPGGERARLIFDTGAWCYFGACAILSLHLWGMGERSLTSWGVVLAVPSAAVLLYVVACILVPSLLTPRRLVFPLPITLPVVFGAMLVLAVELGTRVGPALVAIPEPMRIVLRLSNPFVLAECILADMAILWFAAWVERRRSAAEPTVDSQ